MCLAIIYCFQWENDCEKQHSLSISLHSRTHGHTFAHPHQLHLPLSPCFCYCDLYKLCYCFCLTSHCGDSQCCENATQSRSIRLNKSVFAWTCVCSCAQVGGLLKYLCLWSNIYQWIYIWWEHTWKCLKLDKVCISSKLKQLKRRLVSRSCGCLHMRVSIYAMNAVNV